MGTHHKRCYAYVGSRTSKERNARGIGIRVYAVDPDAVEWKLIQIVEGLVTISRR